MKTLLLYILFAFLGQQTTDNGQQTLSTVMEVEDARPCVSTGDYHCDSSTSNNAYPRTVDCCPLSVDYYESQIRLADSLYKNYLPQYNFDEVKKAVVFFEKSPSLQVSESPSRDDSNNSVTWRLSDSVTQYLGDSVTQRLSDSVTQYLGDSATR